MLEAGTLPSRIRNAAPASDPMPPPMNQEFDGCFICASIKTFNHLVCSLSDIGVVQRLDSEAYATVQTRHQLANKLK